MSKVILGIDLGTTNTVVAVSRDGKNEVLKDSQGRAIQPSVVSFHPNGSVLTGFAAKERRAIDPRNTLFSIKRLIGRGFHARETKEMQERMPFEIVAGDRQVPIIKTRAGDFSAPEVSAIVLDHIKKLAEAALGHSVSEAVITVPASFTEAQRSATSAAGKIAGLDVLAVINEPTAAALAFGYQQDLDEVVAVYDFGGGTFDISILRIQGDRFDVLSSAGDAFLGGDDIDECIVQHMLRHFLGQHGVDLRSDAMALQRLHGVAEQVKIDLGVRTRSLLKVDEIAYGEGGKALDLEMALTRTELEEMADSLVRRSFPVCDEALHQAGLTTANISTLVLVGGTTRMPLVREMAAKYFQREPRTDVNPDEAVAIGAALQGAAMQSLFQTEGAGRVTRPGMGAVSVPAKPEASEETTLTQEETLTREQTRPEETLTREKTRPEETLTREETFTSEESFTGEVTRPQEKRSDELGLGAREPLFEETTNERKAAPPPVPPSRTESSTLAQIKTVTKAVKNPASSIVERGGGLGPSIASNTGPIISEVTAQALGIATVAGYCEHLIKRNASIPGQAVRVFATSRDDQQTVRLRVCQGNDRKFAANTELGDLVLDGLAPRPRGQTKIEVTFRLDLSGRLHVTARDANTGKEQQADLEIIGTQSANDVSAASNRLRAMRK